MTAKHDAKMTFDVEFDRLRDMTDREAQILGLFIELHVALMHVIATEKDNPATLEMLLHLIEKHIPGLMPSLVDVERGRRKLAVAYRIQLEDGRSESTIHWGVVPTPDGYDELPETPEG